MTSGPAPHAHGHHSGDPAAVVMDGAFWDERYRSSSSTVWSGQPNPQLVAEAADLVPGSALDVGCGEGADAIWLAERGWRVTAADISTVALERAAAHARQAGEDVAGRITWLPADITSWLPAAPGYDLVSAQFVHLPMNLRDALFHRLVESVTPGGSLLVVGHHPSDLQTTVPRPPLPELYFSAAEIAALLDRSTWDVVVSEARARPGVDPEGRPVTIHDTVFRAQRRE